MHSQSYQSGQYPKRSLSQTSTTTTSSRDSQHSNEKKHSSTSSNPITRRFRSASKPLHPIAIPQSHSRPKSVSMSQPRDIPRSAPHNTYFDQDHGSTSPVQMSPDESSPRSPKGDFDPKRAPTPTRKNSGDHKRYSGTINHYGRHSNDWLFGGFSVRETVRDSFDKLRNKES
ncbi:hypothetical protein N7533_005567 [Penicillium manginii]|jgi:hypothetical protein|uniref:uncharacterized protein n=1 Tax=Penicillium manginii TaxID=203109 RepID=UPI00254981A5|nr:uncharacterized protein N7533_005567 [Penicillium manginii]KAJ5756024.1 hypothetical protein N7533_005567 [Penicillium manginii]